MERQIRKQLAGAGRGALNLIAVLGVMFAVQWLIRGHVPENAGLVLISATVIVAYVAGSTWIERRKPVELAARAGPAEFALGCAGGFVLFAAVMGMLRAFGNYRPSGWGAVAPLASGFLMALLAAVTEEIVFRGFLFRLTAGVAGTWWALLLTSAFFGAAHAFNPGATVASSVAIALEAGVLLGAAYAVTRRLWLPIGLHLAWNFTEGSVFGMTLSGHSAPNALIVGTLRGPDLLTGGAFGPEASILAVVLCLATAAILLWRVVQLHFVERPAWKGPRTFD